MRYLLLFFSAWLLAGCAGGAELSQVLSQPVDSTVQQHLAHQLHAGKVKFKGQITIQVGTGNSSNATDAGKARAPVATGASQAQDYTKAGQHGGALATAPGASSGATTRTGVPPWELVAGAGLVLLLVLGYMLRRQLAKLFA